MNPVTDPALLALLEGDAPQGGPVYGPPPKAPAPVDPLVQRQRELQIMKTERDLANPGGEDGYATLSPDEVKQMGLAPGKVYQRGANGAIKAVGDAAGAGGAGGDDAARIKLLQAIGKMGTIAKDANDSFWPGLGETGTSGRFMRNMPISGAGYDLNADLDNLRANFAFDALQAMRDASKTGGALGSITERELALLQSTVANLDPNQTHESFLNNINQARQAYLAKLAMIDPQLATRMGYDAKAAEEALLALNESYNREFGIEEAAPVIDRTPNPGAMQTTPDDVAAILSKYGVE